MDRFQKTICTLGIAAGLVLAGITFADCSEEFRCSVDYDCPATQVCNSSTGNCERFVCNVDSDCLDPAQTCDSNECVIPE